MGYFEYLSKAIFGTDLMSIYSLVARLHERYIPSIKSFSNLQRLTRG